MPSARIRARDPRTTSDPLRRRSAKNCPRYLDDETGVQGHGDASCRAPHGLDQHDLNVYSSLLPLTLSALPSSPDNGRCAPRKLLRIVFGRLFQETIGASLDSRSSFKWPRLASSSRPAMDVKSGSAILKKPRGST